MTLEISNCSSCSRYVSPVAVCVRGFINFVVRGVLHNENSTQHPTKNCETDCDKNNNNVRTAQRRDVATLHHTSSNSLGKMIENDNLEYRARACDSSYTYFWNYFGPTARLFDSSSVAPLLCSLFLYQKNLNNVLVRLDSIRSDAAAPQHTFRIIYRRYYYFVIHLFSPSSENCWLKQQIEKRNRNNNDSVEQ